MVRGGVMNGREHTFTVACVDANTPVVMCMYACVCPYVCNNCGMGEGCNHNQIA